MSIRGTKSDHTRVCNPLCKPRFYRSPPAIRSGQRTRPLKQRSKYAQPMNYRWSPFIRVSSLCCPQPLSPGDHGSPPAVPWLTLIAWSEERARWESEVLIQFALCWLPFIVDSFQGNIWEQIFQMSFILEMINTVPFIITVSHVMLHIPQQLCSYCQYRCFLWPLSLDDGW